MNKEKINAQTLCHIAKVSALLERVRTELLLRGLDHDESKLGGIELDVLEECVPKLVNIEYGSDEYKECLKGMKPMLESHYKNNRHHPEHFERGIDDMNLIDLIEMICDWYASTLRTKNGNILKSIDINKKRFGISDQLCSILKNTANDLWGEKLKDV